MTKKWLSYIPVTLAVGLALTLAIVDAQVHPQASFFSTDSLKTLSVLNHQYQMSVEDLSSAKKNSALISELYQADAMLPDGQADPDALGLVATLDGGKTMLLLQPAAPLAPDALAEAAKSYSEAIPEFVHVEMDQTLALESAVWQWNMDRYIPTPQDPVELSSNQDAKVTVAVIDSGMDEDHPIFRSTTVDPGWNAITDDDTMYDDVGHGTHIAGIIASHAPGVEIIPYKIVDANGGKLSNVLKAFTRALKDKVDVINTSFGVSSPSYSLESLIKQAYSQGVIVVSAAGNSGADTEFYPAHYAQTIAVASVDAGGRKLSSSNYGAWVDVAANGYHVRSSLPHNQYGYKTGTSQSTAFVTAAVARLLMADPSMSFEEVVNGLESGSDRIPSGELAGMEIVQ